MTTPAQQPLPVTDDRETGPFWQAAANGRLSLRACLDCGTWLHLPKAFCHNCRSWNTDWKDVSGTGTLHSWTIIRQQLHPAFPVPHALVLVDIDDAPGARLLGRIDGDPPLRAGQAMRVRFDDCGGGVVMPNWKVADDEGSR